MTKCRTGSAMLLALWCLLNLCAYEAKVFILLNEKLSKLQTTFFEDFSLLSPEPDDN